MLTNCRRIFLFLAVIMTMAAWPARASVKSWTKDGDAVNFALDIGSMIIRVCEPDVIEVKYTMLPRMAQKTSLVVINRYGSETGFTVSETASAVVITTKKLKILVDKANNAITYNDLAGNTILAEYGADNKSMQAQMIANIRTYSCGTTFWSPRDEGLFGLGCHPLDSGAINYKGRNQELAIKYLTGAIPVLLSTKGYGLLWDNYSASKFTGADPTKYSYVSESGNQIDYYFFYGPDADRIVSHYRDATGRAPMYGKWAYGLFQSEDRYKTQKEVLAAGAGYRNAHIPVDVVVQDWYYWEPLPIGSHVMNPQRYPDPKAMVD